MRIKYIYLVLAVTSLSLQADTVTSAFCNVSPSQNPSDPGSITQTNPTGCQINPQSGGSAHAFISASSNSSSVSMSANAMVGGLQPLQTAQAEATGTVSLFLSTGGAPRSGFLDFIENITGGNGPDPLDIATANLAIGQYSASCMAVGLSNVGCTGNLSSFNQKLTETTLPFTLGQSFTFTEQMHLKAGSSSVSIAESGQMNSSFQFRFLESDGITPVLVQGAVPEPSTGYLLVISAALSFAAVLLKKHLRLRAFDRTWTTSMLLGIPVFYSPSLGCLLKYITTRCSHFSEASRFY